MNPRPRTGVLIVILASTLWASPARGQDAAGSPPPTSAAPRAVEVMPFVSMDSRGMLPIGAAVSFPLTSSLGIESEVTYRRGEGRLHALSSSANLLYALPRIGRTTPYLATGAGLAQFGAPVVSREGSVIGTAPRIAFEVNAGGGVKVAVDDSLDMRTDARWFKSFGRNASEHWRVSHGVSFDVKRD